MNVAFLQNQWFRDPDAVKRVYARHPDQHARLDAMFLFAGCMTGKRLRAVFGDYCDDIRWANASPKIAAKSDGVFPPDPHHMADIVIDEDPAMVLLFGRVAEAGWLDAVECLREQGVICEGDVIKGPHPAARTATAWSDLVHMRDRYVDQLETCA